MKNKFNKKEYDKKYREEHKNEIKQWKVDLPVKVKEEYDQLLEKINKTKKDFLIESFEKLKKKLETKKIYRVEQENDFNKSIADLHDYLK